MKEFFNKVKILWKDERGNGIIRLSAGIIFMTVLVILAKNSYTTPVKENNNDDNNIISYNHELVSVNKMKYDLKYITNSRIEFGNDETFCRVLDNELSCDSEILFDLEFWNITPKFIESLNQVRENLYVTNYNDGTKESVYNIPLSKFIELFDEETVDITGNIIYSITEDKEDTYKIKLDLSNYYKYITDSESEYIIEIEYLRS